MGFSAKTVCMCVCVCVCVCVCMSSVRPFVCVCVCVCVRARVHTRAGECACLHNTSFLLLIKAAQLHAWANFDVKK